MSSACSGAAAALPLVYSCSGCSSAAQMANQLALRLDHGGVAEMSCIAGVGGDVPALVRKAGSGRPIVTIDGCRLKCSQACLARHGIEPDLGYVLADFGVAKLRCGTVDAGQAESIYWHLRCVLAVPPGLAEPAARAPPAPRWLP